MSVRHKLSDDRAIADFNKALEIDPRYARAYLTRGAVWMWKGDLGRALTDAKEAISLDPTNKEFQEFLVYVKSKIKERHETTWTHQAMIQGLPVKANLFNCDPNVE